MPSAEQVTAAAAIGQVAVVAAALWYARGQLSEARTDRESRTRPFVVIDLDGERVEHMIYLEVSNIGPSIAYNVRFRFDPPLETTLDSTGHGVTKMALFTEGAPSIAPGRRISCLFDVIPDRHTAGLSGRYEVHVTYEGEADRKGERRRYSETQILDPDAFLDRLFVGRDYFQEVKRIREAVERLPGMPSA